MTDHLLSDVAKREQVKVLRVDGKETLQTLVFPQLKILPTGSWKNKLKKKKTKRFPHLHIFVLGFEPLDLWLTKRARSFANCHTVGSESYKFGKKVYY